MPHNHEHLVHARALRADILGAPDVWLPRREILLTWLDAFLKRATRQSCVLEPVEVGDLDALDQFLRTQNVPVA